MSHHGQFHPRYHKHVVGLVEVTLGEHLLIGKMLVRHQHLVDIPPASFKSENTTNTNSFQRNLWQCPQGVCVKSGHKLCHQSIYTQKSMYCQLVK